MSRNFRRMERKRYCDSNKPYYRSRSQQKYSKNETNRECSDRYAENMVSHGRKSWYEMVQEEDEIEETDFEVQHLQMTSNEFVDADKNCLEMHESSSMRVRQDSCMSSSSGSWSNNTSENSKKAMSMTPRFTHDELQTEEIQAILTRRQKQIQYGKTQECYRRYLKLVPRQRRTKYHPRTPDIYRKYSRRGFDTLIRVWKKQLHAWEPDETEVQSSRLELPCESTVTTNKTETTLLKNEPVDGVDPTECPCALESKFSPSCSAAEMKSMNEGSSFRSSQEIKNIYCSENGSMGDVTIKTEIPDEYLT